MNHVDPITHIMALGTIILVSGFFAVMFAGMALFGKLEEEMDAPDFEPGEIDNTPYPEDEENVIFPKY